MIDVDGLIVECFERKVSKRIKGEGRSAMKENYLEDKQMDIIYYLLESLLL